MARDAHFHPRSLPPPLRFLGRRFYFEAVVLLASVAAQLETTHLAKAAFLRGHGAKDEQSWQTGGFVTSHLTAYVPGVTSELPVLPVSWTRVALVIRGDDAALDGEAEGLGHAAALPYPGTKGARAVCREAVMVERSDAAALVSLTDRDVVKLDTAATDLIPDREAAAPGQARTSGRTVEGIRIRDFGLLRAAPFMASSVAVPRMAQLLSGCDEAGLVFAV